MLSRWQKSIKCSLNQQMIYKLFLMLIVISEASIQIWDWKTKGSKIHSWHVRFKVLKTWSKTNWSKRDAEGGPKTRLINPAQAYALIHRQSQQSTFTVTDSRRSAQASGHERGRYWQALSLPSESKPAAVTAASNLKKLDLHHYRAVQDQAEVAGKPAKNAFPSVVIFSRQRCNLLANQLKIHLKERTTGVKQDGLFKFVMSLGQSIQDSHLLLLKFYSDQDSKGWLLNLLLFNHSVVPDSLWPHGLQHTRLPCPSPSPGACPNSCPLNQWCHPTTSWSVVPFSSCPQSFPASGIFIVSWLFSAGGQSIGASASASVLPMNIQGWLPLGLTG